MRTEAWVGTEREKEALGWGTSKAGAWVGHSSPFPAHPPANKQNKREEGKRIGLGGPRLRGEGPVTWLPALTQARALLSCLRPADAPQ